MCLDANCLNLLKFCWITLFCVVFLSTDLTTWKATDSLTMPGSPTVVGRHIPPKAIGVPGFSFPVFCRIFHDVKRQREKRIFVSWKPVGGVRGPDGAMRRTRKGWSGGEADGTEMRHTGGRQIAVSDADSSARERRKSRGSGGRMGRVCMCVCSRAPLTLAVLVYVCMCMYMYMCMYVRMHE